MGVLSRIAGIAIAIIVLFFAGTGIAAAAGVNVWDAVATWTDDTFAFSSNSGNLTIVSSQEATPQKYCSLQDALDAYDVNVPLAPKWIPKEYHLEDIVVTERGDEILFFATFASSTGTIDMRIKKLSSASFSIIEKDVGNVETYRKNGIDHYLMTNEGFIQAS